MSRKPLSKAEVQRGVVASKQISSVVIPQEKKMSQAKKAIHEAAMYEASTTTSASKTADDYEASKVGRKANHMTEEDKKAVEALNVWGGGVEDDDDDDF